MLVEYGNVEANRISGNSRRRQERDSLPAGHQLQQRTRDLQKRHSPISKCTTAISRASRCFLLIPESLVRTATYSPRLPRDPRNRGLRHRGRMLSPTQALQNSRPARKEAKGESRYCYRTHRLHQKRFLAAAIVDFERTSWEAKKSTKSTRLGIDACAGGER
jgi:hypothetical protein